MFFHYTKNKEINGNLKYIKPDIGIIKGIYKIGISAAIMQALLSVMMAGMNAILGGAKADPTILVGSFGIYYKIQQIALFSAFGLSNTIISILSFNYGMKDKERINDCIKYGIIDTAKEHTKKKYRELFKERLFFRTIRVGSMMLSKAFFLGPILSFSSGESSERVLPKPLALKYWSNPNSLFPAHVHISPFNDSSARIVLSESIYAIAEIQ